MSASGVLVRAIRDLMGAEYRTWAASQQLADEYSYSFDSSILMTLPDVYPHGAAGWIELRSFGSSWEDYRDDHERHLERVRREASERRERQEAFDAARSRTVRVRAVVQQGTVTAGTEIDLLEDEAFRQKDLGLVIILEQPGSDLERLSLADIDSELSEGDARDGEAAKKAAAARTLLDSAEARRKQHDRELVESGKAPGKAYAELESEISNLRRAERVYSDDAAAVAGPWSARRALLVAARDAIVARTQREAEATAEALTMQENHARHLEIVALANRLRELVVQIRCSRHRHDELINGIDWELLMRCANTRDALEAQRFMNPAAAPAS